MCLLPMNCWKWNNPCFKQYLFKTKRLVEVSLGMEWNRQKEKIWPTSYIFEQSFCFEIWAELLLWAAAERIPSAGNRPWQDLILLANWPRNNLIMIGKGIGLGWDFGQQLAQQEKSKLIILTAQARTRNCQQAQVCGGTDIGLVGTLLMLWSILEGNRSHTVIACN